MIAAIARYEATLPQSPTPAAPERAPSVEDITAEQQQEGS
jgi:hypothetical protein